MHAASSHGTCHPRLLRTVHPHVHRDHLLHRHGKCLLRPASLHRLPGHHRHLVVHQLHHLDRERELQLQVDSRLRMLRRIGTPPNSPANTARPTRIRGQCAASGLRRTTATAAAAAAVVPAAGDTDGEEALEELPQPAKQRQNYTRGT